MVEVNIDVDLLQFQWLKLILKCSIEAAPNQAQIATAVCSASASESDPAARSVAAMSKRDTRQVYRYTCPACGSEFYSDKIKSGDFGFSMDEIDRAIRRRKDSKHWDHRWHCQVTSGERWVEGVWCSWVHPGSTCMSTRVDESMVQQGEVVGHSARVLAIDDGSGGGGTGSSSGGVSIGGSCGGDTGNGGGDDSGSLSSRGPAAAAAEATVAQTTVVAAEVTLATQSSRGPCARRVAPCKVRPDAPWKVDPAADC